MTTTFEVTSIFSLIVCQYYVFFLLLPRSLFINSYLSVNVRIYQTFFSFYLHSCVRMVLQEFKSERYRLKLIVDELQNKENPLDYKTTLLAFVNCLIISTPQLKDRVRIRNEFIGNLFIRYFHSYINFIHNLLICNQYVALFSRKLNIGGGGKGQRGSCVQITKRHSKRFTPSHNLESTTNAFIFIKILRYRQVG